VRAWAVERRWGGLFAIEILFNEAKNTLGQIAHDPEKTRRNG
jgi:hypothetical protein